MRQVTLSDFVGDRIREAQRERTNRFEFERRAYELSAPKGRGQLIAMLGVVAIAVIAMMIDPILGILPTGAIPLGILAGLFALSLLAIVTKGIYSAPKRRGNLIAMLGVVAIAVIAQMIGPIWWVTSWYIPWGLGAGAHPDDDRADTADTVYGHP